MRQGISIRGLVRRSVRPPAGPSVSPVLFSNDKKRHVQCPDDDEISHGVKESQGKFKTNIRMLVHRSVCPSDVRKKERKNERKKEKKKKEKQEPRGS